MSIDYRQAIKDFIEKNKAVMGDIDAVVTEAGETIVLSDMTDEQAKKAAEVLFIVGTPTRLGALGKRRDA
jgi:NADP-dependent 3-hydroxy acid dehydrogenase YdfG